MSSTIPWIWLIILISDGYIITNIMFVDAKPMLEATEVLDGRGDTVPLLWMKLDIIQ